VYERKGAFTPYESSTGCNLLIHIYPTKQFEAAYRSNDPVIKTVAIVECFVITAVFFILYNIAVEYRQTKLVKDATNNSRLVGSFFPEAVRDHLVEYTTNKKKDIYHHGPIPGTSVSAVSLLSAPIADRFESATVFFADIAGCMY
jgi:hypothetical protein